MKGKNKMEKHIHTVLLSIITSVLIGSGSMQIFSYKAIGVMQFQLEDVGSKMGQFITRSEIEQRNQYLNLQIKTIEDRLDALEFRKKLK